MAKLIMYWFCYLVFVMMVYGMERRVMSVLKVHDSSKFKLYDKRQIQAETGQNITLSGWFNSSAVPEYRFNGEPIKESKNIRITWYQNNRILTILKLEDTHTGFYELYHPSLKKSDQIYLYVKSENIFVPSISYKLFCYEPICIVPCRLTNYADESGVVRLFLDGREQNRTYDPRVGYEIPQNQLENNVVNAACHKGYRKVHYTIELQDKLPNDWKLTIVNTNPWPNLNETVHFKCSLSYNTNYAASIEIKLLYQDAEQASHSKKMCHIVSTNKSQISNHNNMITTEKEFRIPKYTPNCRGKLICKVMNMTSNRSFNRHSTIYLDQLEITSRTDDIVETTVKQKEKIATVLKAPSEVRQHIDIKWSRLSEKLSCRESACLISNETKVFQLITTDKTNISIFQDIEEDKPGWHRYSAQFYKKGSNESIQEVFWDVYVRAPVEQRTNCSSLLLKPTVCMFTLISSVPDKSKMFISRLGKTDEISSYETETTCGKFHCLMTYLVNITRTTSIEGRSSTDKPKMQKIFCVEFSFSVDPSFDNSDTQDIYEGDNVTVKGGIAESNDTFRIRSGSSLFSSLTREYSETILTNVSSSFDRIFRLFNSTEHILATIQIPAPKKIVAPHSSTTKTIYYSESVTQLICPTEGSPIVYNWTKNGIPIKEHNRRHLFLDTLDPLGDFKCCGINRVGTKCSIINLKLTSALWSAKTASIAVSIVVTIIFFFVVSRLIYIFMNDVKVILLTGPQGAGKTTLLNMSLNFMKVKNVMDLNKSNIEFASRFDYKTFGISEHKDLMKKPDLLFGEPAEEQEDHQSATRDPRCIKPLRYNGQMYAIADIPGFDKEDRMIQNWTRLLSNLWHYKLRRVHCIGLVIKRDNIYTLFNEEETHHLLTMLPKKSAAVKTILTNSNFEDLKGLTLDKLSVMFTHLRDPENLKKRGYVEMNNNMLPFLVVRGIEKSKEYEMLRAICVEKEEWITFFDIQGGKKGIDDEISKSDPKRELDVDGSDKRLKNAKKLCNSISSNFHRSRDVFLELLEDVRSYEPILIRTLWLAHINNQADDLIIKLASALSRLRVENSRKLAQKTFLSLLIDDIFELGKQKIARKYASEVRRKNTRRLFRIAIWAIINWHSSAFESLVKLFDILAKAMWESSTSEPFEESLLDCLQKLSKTQYPEQLKKIFSFLSRLAKSDPASFWGYKAEKAELFLTPRNMNDSEPFLVALCGLLRFFKNECTEDHRLYCIELDDSLSAIRRLLEPSLFVDILTTFKPSNIPSSLREAEAANESEQNYSRTLSPIMRTLSNLIFTRAFIGDRAEIAEVLQSLRTGDYDSYSIFSTHIPKDRLSADVENAIRFLEDTIVEPSKAMSTNSSEPSYLLSLFMRFLHGIPDFLGLFYRWCWIVPSQDREVSRENTSSARYNASEETVQLMIPKEQVQPQTRMSEIKVGNSSDQRGTFAEDDSNFNVDYSLHRSSEPSNVQREKVENSSDQRGTFAEDDSETSTAATPQPTRMIYKIVECRKDPKHMEYISKIYGNRITNSPGLYRVNYESHDTDSIFDDTYRYLVPLSDTELEQYELEQANTPDSLESSSLSASDESITCLSDRIAKNHSPLSEYRGIWPLVSDEPTTSANDNDTGDDDSEMTIPGEPSEIPSEHSYLLSLILRFLRGIPEFFRTLYRWCWIEPRQDREIKQMQRETKKKLEKYIEILNNPELDYPELRKFREEMESLADQVMEPKKP